MGVWNKVRGCSNGGLWVDHSWKADADQSCERRSDNEADHDSLSAKLTPNYAVSLQFGDS